MLLHRLTVLSDLDSTHFNIIINKIFFSLIEACEGVKLYLLIGSLITKAMKLFHSFHLLTTLWTIRDVEDSSEAKSTCTTNYITNIVLLTDIM